MGLYIHCYKPQWQHRALQLCQKLHLKICFSPSVREFYKFQIRTEPQWSKLFPNLLTHKTYTETKIPQHTFEITHIVSSSSSSSSSSLSGMETVKK